jgi:hypothetical protein
MGQGAIRRSYRATLRGNQARLSSPLEAARTAKNADAPMHQSREAHHSVRPRHSPEGANGSGRFEPTGDRP